MYDGVDKREGSEEIRLVGRKRVMWGDGIRGLRYVD